MTVREQSAERFATRVTGRVVRQLVEDCGLLLAQDAELVLHNVVASEFLRQLAPEGTAKRIVEEAFRRGLALDDEG